MDIILTSKFELNAQIAESNRALLEIDGVTAVSLMGPSGAGKTTVIEAIARKLMGDWRIAAIIANPAAVREAERLSRLGVRTIAVRTDNPTARDIHAALAELDLGRIDLIFIESGGNNLPPVEFDLGQHVRIAVFSAAGGDDKATEYAHLIAESDMALLTKIDLLPFVDFDLEVFLADLARIHPHIQTMHISGRTGGGVDASADWLIAQCSARKRFSTDRGQWYSEWFHG